MAKKSVQSPSHLTLDASITVSKESGDAYVTVYDPKQSRYGHAIKTFRLTRKEIDDVYAQNEIVLNAMNY